MSTVTIIIIINITHKAIFYWYYGYYVMLQIGRKQLNIYDSAKTFTYIL